MYNSDMAKKILSTDDVLHLARLANLQLTEKQVEKLKQQLSETLDYVENLSQLDTSKVEATAQTTNLINVEFTDGEKMSEA
jgi:aspartyl-tRNA(Asn)/glutamyl-tRNA(Gln) amidotransferase subunit C